MRGAPKDIPSGWIETTIQELFAALDDDRTLHQGWSPQCEKVASGSEDEWGVLRTTSIQAGRFLPEHNKRLPDNLVPRPLLEVRAGDILITCAGPRVRCGVASLVRSVRKRLMMSGKMYRFRVPDDFIDPRYVEGYIQTPEAQSAIDAMKTGGSDSGLNLTHSRFRQLPIRVAPLNEQRRIMDTLEELESDLDAGITALERVKKKLTQYRAALLKAATEGTLTEDWRKQHADTEPASILLTRILAERRCCWEQDQLRKFLATSKEPHKNWKARYNEPSAPDATSLPALPDGWCWATCDQLAWNAGYGTSEKCRESNSGLAVLRIPNIIAGKLDVTDLKYAPPDYSEREEDLVRAGDLLIVRTNGSRDLIGRGAVVRGPLAVRLSFASYLIRLRLVPLSPLLRWVALTWGSAHVRQWIESRAATSAGQFNINLRVLCALPVPIPPLAEQEAIADIVED